MFIYNSSIRNTFFLFFPISSILTPFFVILWKVPHRLMCLSIWCPMGGTVRRDYENPRRWSLRERSGPLGELGVWWTVQQRSHWLSQKSEGRRQLWTPGWKGITSVYLPSLQTKFHKRQTLGWKVAHKIVSIEELQNWPRWDGTVKGLSRQRSWSSMKWTK